MDFNIKQELIDQINQLGIKKEEDSSELHEMPHQVAKFRVELSTGAIINVIRPNSVSNDNLVQTFSHRTNHADRIYKVISTNRSPKTIVIVKQVILARRDGNTFDYRNLTFEFGNFGLALPFINELNDLHYNPQ
ncbi:hypothetical protein M3Y98_00388400 [Aphelenchoides besseyi]|nr:hypothetical protein M3Y98_00388400 [Aphelenchoides besseyi]KAI6201984.1 hypothetical protein M3Y96_00900300 [Aphelenchoides besseyi]